MKFKTTPPLVVASNGNFIDIARLIGIACVIYGHCHPFYGVSEKVLREVIYCFHMPLFFIISGILDRPKKSISVKTYRKIFIALVIPYFIYNIPYLPIEWSNPTSFVYQLLTASVPPNDPTWFFFALLWVKIITVAMRNHEVELFCFSIVVYLVLQYCGVKMDTFCCSHSILTGIVFYYLGKLYYQFLESKYMYASILLSILLVAYSVMTFGRYDMYWGKVGNPILYLLTAGNSSIAVLAICKWLEKSISAQCMNKVVKPLSRGTMIIVGTHYMLAHFANKMLFTKYSGMGIKVLYVVALLFVYWVIIKCTYKSVPILYGKTYSNR